MMPISNMDGFRIFGYIKVCRHIDGIGISLFKNRNLSNFLYVGETDEFYRIVDFRKLSPKVSPHIEFPIINIKNDAFEIGRRVPIPYWVLGRIHVLSDENMVLAPEIVNGSLSKTSLAMDMFAIKAIYTKVEFYVGRQDYDAPSSDGTVRYLGAEMRTEESISDLSIFMRSDPEASLEWTRNHYKISKRVFRNSDMRSLYGDAIRGITLSWFYSFVDSVEWEAYLYMVSTASTYIFSKNTGRFLNEKYILRQSNLENLVASAKYYYRNYFNGNVLNSQYNRSIAIDELKDVAFSLDGLSRGFRRRLVAYILDISEIEFRDYLVGLLALDRHRFFYGLSRKYSPLIFHAKYVLFFTNNGGFLSKNSQEFIHMNELLGVLQLALKETILSISSQENIEISSVVMDVIFFSSLVWWAQSRRDITFDYRRIMYIYIEQSGMFVNYSSVKDAVKDMVRNYVGTLFY